ncbi:unnamed protein product [Acanthoscelides obtectus]|uniref:Uncharacterized protein n=1 Tax=Acanthoscelides obtectus TaxID=200917 RepID=A0A9P0KVQ5_ACAOB|nr:unnamed protein product [Acanthoscelides obtectus]CAK1626281.1 hypothetical protein AOBTE_LOCUS3747 [Acanthoscelides obtectus]
MHQCLKGTEIKGSATSKTSEYRPVAATSPSGTRTLAQPDDRTGSESVCQVSMQPSTDGYGHACRGNRVDENPSTSTRDVAREVQVSKTKV